MAFDQIVILIKWRQQHSESLLVRRLDPVIGSPVILRGVGLSISSNRIYLNGGGDSIVKDVFEKLLRLYAHKRIHVGQIIGDFYELPRAKAVEELKNPATSSMMYAAFETTELSIGGDFITFPIFYAPYIVVANIPGLCNGNENITTLLLTYHLLREILQGNVTTWNHFDIQTLNPVSNSNVTNSCLSNDNIFCLERGPSYLHSPLFGAASLCYAIPFSLSFSSRTQADLYNLMRVELTESKTKLMPSLPSIESSVYDLPHPAAYPLFAKISITTRNLWSTAGRLTSNVCREAAELKRFLKWILTSHSAKEVLDDALCVRVDSATSNRVLKSDLSSIKCRQNKVLTSVDAYAQRDTETLDIEGEDGDLDTLTILLVTGNCFGILLFVFGLMLIRRFLNQLAEIRNDVWMIKELDLIPSDSERLESFTTLISQVSSRQSYSQIDLRETCQRCSIATPCSSVADMRTIFGIYKSISVTLCATRIPLSTAFDYATRKALIGLRKISHSNVLRFYGLANLGDKDIRTFLDGIENEAWRFAPEDDISDNQDFAMCNTDLPYYYAVREQCTGESIFFFMHCSSMNFPTEAKIPVIVQLIDAVDYLHGHGIVHGKLNSQCCYFDHNFNIKVSDWEHSEMLEKYLRLHTTDVYLPSKFIAFLQKNSVIRSTSDKKNRILQCLNMNGVMRLRWRPPECLSLELPLVKKSFLHPPNPTNDRNELHELAEGGENDGEINCAEIPLSHFQDPTVDIYSIGVLINEVWSRAIPYSEIDPEYRDEFQLLDAISRGDLKLEISPSIPAILENIVNDCISLVPMNRPNISSLKKQVNDLADTTQTGLDVYLDIMDRRIKDTERRVANLDEEERCLNEVQEAIFREFLPKSLVENALFSISHEIDEKTTLDRCFSTSRYSRVTVCALRLLNFNESTQTLPLDEVFLALNRLSRMLTNIVEDWKVLRISSFGNISVVVVGKSNLGTMMMMTSDPQSEDNDAAKQAISVAECALDLHNCLRCFGKVPRTEVEPEFAIALDTGAVSMALRNGSAPT
ncbi:unnamed protein product [Hydatigera taeniaeformis]|uniref:Guanylate cyclase n=1 Tax=Hydatigena taeniaeformis TaxID=6205 RepID=A0A0R3WJR7_HYDTA|nr:unnamed protein product [Hydatigera taeniaeformis]